MLLNFHVVAGINTSADYVLTESTGLSIKGQVKEKNAPIPCRIRLFEKISGRLVMETVTDHNGFYGFSHLTKIKFFIVAHHPAGEFNAVIQDNVEPK